ncbi:unnamed protein product, partial [Prorocentrum cordatum]
MATRCCSGATAPPWPAAAMLMVGATSRRCPRVAAGGRHTVLLRSDGTAVACGDNDDGQCVLPALPAGLTYTQVAAGGRHAVLLRSDGTAVACGWNDDGQCDLPALPAGLTYTAHLLPALLLQVSLDGGSMVFVTIGGVERCRIRAAPTARLADIHLQLVAEHRAGRLGPGAWRVEAILPGGRPLSAAAEETDSGAHTLESLAPVRSGCSQKLRLAEAFPGVPRTGSAEPVPRNRFHRTGSAGPVPQNRFHKPGSTVLQVPQDRFHRSDGTAVARGWNADGQCDLPALPAGLTYTQVAAGGLHTVLLRSDGTAVARGRSDGTAVACGDNDHGQCDLPALPAGLTYTQVAAGGRHTVLLRSDGTAVACGDNDHGQCDLPALPAGLTYTQVAAGGRHTVLLRSDGTAVACGWNADGQCDLPALPAGLTYTQVAAGGRHTVLLRSDGTAVARGWNADGQSDLPALPAGLTYTAHLLPALLLQVSLDGGSMVFVTIGGVERCRIRAAPTARLADIHLQLVAEHRAGRLGPGAWRVEAILPGGRPLSAAAEET